MSCRIDVFGQKIWVDDNNKYDTRPTEVEIVLYKDEVEEDSVILDSNSSGRFYFPCLIASDKNKDFYYRVDERDIPTGYFKIINGNNIMNVLENITIDGEKIWNDNFNSGDTRPADITVRLYRNGVEVDSITVTSPPDIEDRVSFTFGSVPFADANGVPYVYTVDEDDVTDYVKIIDGFTITNTLGIIP